MKKGNSPGTYILVIALPHKCTFEVGSLGKVPFERGYYLYVGSALAGLQSRLQRHMRARKRLHWHIDYLLEQGHIREIWYHQDPKRHECTWADVLQRMADIVPSKVPFGASDCDCRTHLFYSKTRPRLSAFEEELAEKVRMSKKAPSPL